MPGPGRRSGRRLREGGSFGWVGMTLCVMVVDRWMGGWGGEPAGHRAGYERAWTARTARPGDRP